MDRVAGDGGDVDDRASPGDKRRGKAARELERGEEIELEHGAPALQIAVQDAEPFLERRLGRDGGVVDQGMERPAVEERQASA